MGDQEEFQAILQRSGIVLTCQSCGGTSWSVVRSDLAIHNSPGDLKPVFLVRCDHCGRQRLFSPSDPDQESGE